MSDTPDHLDVLARVADVIASRKGGDPEKSYVARLFHKGTDTILKKVGEEATETVLAAKDLAAAPESAAARQALVGELADLWFHSMVAMAHLGLGPQDVVAELARREGLSGLEEFARRSAPANKPVV
ncbi:phosphoribosyl-ATP diphosphatase [Aquabacterium olei]|uniref:Phosphoribosyl-ATP pyrophosphatase n=1 Tax=Aquabacterium olei TaxID=1296669 RepID=A0A2U8FPN1_9BURK|nr:phosphoribosyl-ATP diphosphatase [Aquabacterium olei]AWI52907.1 phosphoribosyl-ATP diphosphatase [Aquabacterium olei]